MKEWLRVRPMQVKDRRAYNEKWISPGAKGSPKHSYEVNVCLGKPVDILGLKSNIVKSLESEAEYIGSSRKALFGKRGLERVKNCPVCKTPSSGSRFALKIYGALYHQCSVCSHIFVIERPTSGDLDKFYSKDERYASDYTNIKIRDLRVKQVNLPKAKWVVERFKDLYGRKPTSVLDVGAGGGHFVHACRQLGINAKGIELSEASRRFSKDNFNIELEPSDFTRTWDRYPDVDVVTFWGVIEHVSDPMGLLGAAHKALSGKDALAVAEVPRFTSLSTAVQSMFPSTITRHLDPLHIQFFTDDSLATAFEAAGLAPVGAWYFGMDIYELITQFSMILKDSRLVDVMGKYIGSLQNTVDEGILSDAMVFAGKPMGRKKR